MEAGRRGLDSSETFVFLQVFIKHTRTPLGYRDFSCKPRVVEV